MGSQLSGALPPPPCSSRSANVFGLSVAVPSPQAALTVLGGSAGVTCTASILGATLGVLRQERGRPPLLLATRGAYNAFAVAFPFFAVREYIVKPILDPQLNAQDALPQPHTHNVLSSSASGLAVGLGVKAVKSIPWSASARLGVLFAVLAGSGQFLVNETDLARRRWIARGERKRIEERESRLDMGATDPPATSASTSEQQKQTQTQTQTQTQALSSSGKHESWYTSWIPLKKLSDDQYAERLMSQRAEMLKELDEVNAEVDRVIHHQPPSSKKI